MSKAIQGAAMLAGAVGMGIAAFYDPALIASPLFDKVWASLVIGGISMEASAIAGALTQNRGMGITTRQAAALRQIIYGEQRVGGVSLYQSTTGSHHDQYNFIIVLAGHEIDSIVNLYLDGRQVYWEGSGDGWSVRNGVGFGGNPDKNNHIGPGGQHYNFGTLVYCEARFGDQSSGDVIGAMTANDPNWAADGHGNSPYCGGCAYVYLKIEFDTAMFPNSPEIKFTVRGKNDILDPRTNTRGFSTNWALIIADVIEHNLFGLEDVNSVNTDQLIAAANVCDEQVPLAIGGTESRYCLHWHYDAGSSPGDQLQTMMNAAMGRLSRIGGEWFIWPAYWQGPSFSFDESIFTGPVEWTPYRSLRELVNRVQGTYIAPNSPWNVAGNLYDANGWYDGSIANQFPFAFQPTNYPQYAQDQLHGYPNDQFLDDDSGVLGPWDSATTYAAGDVVTQSFSPALSDGTSYIIYLSLQDANSDNSPSADDPALPVWWVAWSNQLPLELSQSCCLSVAQAQRCAKIALLRNRQQGTGVFPMHLEAWKSQPLDVMQIGFADMGWGGKQFEISDTKFVIQQEDGPSTVRFEASVMETDQSIYEWSTTEELSVYDVPSNVTQAPYAIDPPSDLTLLSDATTAVIGADGVNIPRILATWTPPGDARVSQIQVQYSLDASPINWVDAGTVDADTSSDYISGVVAGQMYFVQIRSLTNMGATSVWVQAGPVTVGGPSSLQNTYSNSPAVSLSQPTPTTIGMVEVAVTFGGNTVNYAPRSITIPTPAVPTWYYVTIADPAQAGEAGISPSPTLTATAATNTNLCGVVGNTYMGAVLALPAGSAFSELAGGWPAPQTIQVGA